MDPPATSPPRAGRRAWLGLAAIALPCVVYTMDLTVLELALPALSADLHPSGAELLWIVDIYGFVVAAALVTMGALGDRIGARRLLMVGAAAFAAASVLAAFATTPAMLIGARALLGLAGATLAPSTLSLIRTLFPDPGQRTFAIGVWVTSYSAGAAIGPLVGGVLLQWFWWGSVFLVAVPVMGALLLLAPRLLPEQRADQAGRLDLPSAGLSLAAVLAVVWGLKQLATAGDTTSAVAAIAGGLVLGALFARRQGRLAEPLIDLRLFRVPVFSVALATNLVAFFAVFGLGLLRAQYLQSVLGLSPLVAGLWSVPEALGFVAGSMLAPRLIGRLTQVTVIAGGTLVGAVGFGVVAVTGLAPVVAGTTVAAIGLGVVVTIVTDVAVSAAPPERAGAAAATSETSSELGGAIGIALLGSLAAAVYRAGVPDGTGPTIGDAVATSRGAGAGSGVPLLADARDAFTHALTITASVSAALLLIAAVTAAAVLRRRPGPTVAATAGEPLAATG